MFRCDSSPHIAIKFIVKTTSSLTRRNGPHNCYEAAKNQERVELRTLCMWHVTARGESSIALVSERIRYLVDSINLTKFTVDRLFNFKSRLRQSSGIPKRKQRLSPHVQPRYFMIVENMHRIARLRVHKCRSRSRGWCTCGIQVSRFSFRKWTVISSLWSYLHSVENPHEAGAIYPAFGAKWARHRRPTTKNYCPQLR